MRTVNVEISVSSLYDIAEKACKAYRKELAEAEFLSDIQRTFDSLADVIRLWEAVDDNFDCEDDLILTLERREEEKDGSDNRN